jgi:hypothetical protein
VSKSTSAPAHPSTEEHDDTVEAHYACLERPQACIGGVVYVGHLVEGDDGVSVGAAHSLERVMNFGENRIEMRIPRSAWLPHDLRSPHS